MSLIEDVEKLMCEVERRVHLYKRNLKEFSNKTLNEKLWYEVCGAIVTNWIELPVEQKSQKDTLLFLLILLAVMRWRSYTGQKRTYYKVKYRGFDSC
jgi:hypothetical protein